MPQMSETPDSTGETRPDDVAAVIERACNEETMTREADLEAPTSEITRFGRTVESFRYRDFSLFWSGAFVSNVGTWMQNTALGLVVVYGLNQGAFVLGFINFLSGIPVLFLALPGGALADRVDRRRLIIAFQWILLVQAAALGYLAMNGTVAAITGPAAAQHAMQALFWLGGLGMIAGVCSALTFPAWQALLPAMVPRKVPLNAIALNSAQFQSLRLLGPLVAAAPANNATSTLGTPVTLTATVTQESATVNQVDFYNGATLLGTVVLTGSGPYTYNGWTPPATGIYNITAKVTYNTTSKLYTPSNKLTVVPPPVSPVTITNIIGTTLTYGGGGGSHFVLLSSATADAAMSAWTTTGLTNNATPGSFTIPAVGTSDAIFYRVLSLP